ncbi:MAG: hypothetical protein FJZ90_16430, partial [Chloroflexi bacterium]|nr:hypothetical protein [Chloroflexota bacterium]
QFEGPVLEEWRQALVAAGAEVLDYIPDFCYHVAAEAHVAEALKDLPGVIWVGPWRTIYVVSPDIGPTLRGARPRPVRVEFDEAPDPSLQEHLQALGIVWIGQEGRAVAVEADAAGLAVLSRLPGVRWIAPLSLPQPLNDVATGEIRAPSAWNLGFRGEGETVAIADTGLDTGVDYPHVPGDMHRDLDGRVTYISSWPISSLYDAYLNNPRADDGAADRGRGHGTHVAGSAVGNGFHSDGRIRGVAYQSYLAFQALEQYCDVSPYGETVLGPDGYYLAGIPADLARLYAQAYGWGARVHNNSWGDTAAGQEGVYTLMAQQTDRFVWQNRDLVVLFAAGGEARDANGDGLADYGSVLSPATAKNVIAVGGTENRRPTLIAPLGYRSYGELFTVRFPVDPLRSDPMANAGGDGMMAFSGRGPCRDGRIAPHVVAPGTWVASLRSSRATEPAWPSDGLGPYYMYLGGTSMSTPLVAGGAMLVRQAYLMRGHAPSAALVKATLIQTARDLPGQYGAPFGEAGPIPNNNEGWGLVDLQAAVAPGRFYVDESRALKTGERVAYEYYAGAMAQPVKFTLVWTDYPAAVQAGAALVNDLDLIVTAPDGQVYRGNSFSGGWAVAGGTHDRINNVECVYLPRSQSGFYRVEVRAYNVPQGPQSFALLASVPPPSEPLRLMLPLVLRRHALLPTTPTPSPTATLTPTLVATVVASTASPTATSTSTPTLTPSAP